MGVYINENPDLLSSKFNTSPEAVAFRQEVGDAVLRGQLPKKASDTLGPRIDAARRRLLQENTL